MKKRVFLILKIVFLLLIILSLNVLFSWHNDKKEVERILEVSDDLIEEVDQNNDVKYVISEEARYRNADMVGWLKVEGTRIDYPVVKAKDNK